MDFVKKVNALVLGLAVLLAVGCGGDEDKKAEPVYEKCELVAAEYLWGGNRSLSTINYDSAGRIAQITTNISNGGTIIKETVTYNSKGQIIKLSGNDGGYRSFEYNPDGKLSDIHTYHTLYNASGITYQTHSTFEYDTDKRLIKSSEYNMRYGGRLFSYSTYTYPAANTVKETFYDMDNDTVRLYSEGEYIFDDKIGISSLIGVSRVNHLQTSPLGSNIGYHGNDGLLSAHNLLSLTIKSFKSGYKGAVTNTYTYNSSGYPIRRVTRHNSNSGPGDRTIYAYNCQ